MPGPTLPSALQCVDSVFDNSARLDLFGRDLKDALEHQCVQHAYVEPLHGWRSRRHRVSHRGRVLEPQEPQLDPLAAERDRDRALPRLRERRAHRVGAAELLDREQWRHPRIEGRDRLRVETPRHAIRRQDHQPRIVAGDQRHHRVVVGLRDGGIVLGRATAAAILERGFVAMVSVGDEDARALEFVLNRRDCRLVLDRAQLVANAEVVGDFQRWLDAP